MSKDLPDYSPYELMTVLLARDFRDGEIGYGGGASNELPMAACMLAQKLHAPNLTFVTPCGSVNAHPTALHRDGKDCRFLRGVEAVLDLVETVEMSENGKVGFFCYQGMQIDQYGNFNLHYIGDPKAPRMRGPGLVNLSHTVRSNRTYLYPTEHTRRRLVERVDFISAPGYIDGPGTRERLGMTGAGPCLCISPLAVFDFHEGRMRLRSIHEWTTLEQVLDNMGFQPTMPERVEMTKPPTAEELRILREEVDTTGVLRGMG